MKEFIQGKRVALIGGSIKAVGTGLGEYIDAHNTVVRINIHWPCSKYLNPQRDTTEDIGKRTDVLILSSAAVAFERFLKLKDEDVKLVMLRYKRRDYKKITNYCNQAGIPHKLYSYPKPDIQGMIFTGILALCGILSENPKEVFMTGFDFYVDDIRPQCHHRKGSPVYSASESSRDYFLNHIMSDKRVLMADHVRESLFRPMPRPYEHEAEQRNIRMI